MHILVLNAGSSSIKFSLFEASKATSETMPVQLMRGQVDGIGKASRLVAKNADGEKLTDRTLHSSLDTHEEVLQPAIELITEHFPDMDIQLVGHRVVHGGLEYAGPVLLDKSTIAALEKLTPFAPLHQPHNLAGIRAAEKAFPKAQHIAGFDTAFHRSHPWVNDTFALPRSYYDKGVRRYGFHGLSYDYICKKLREVAPHHASGGVVVAHLGNGASMTAIRDGLSVGSSMGFSALDGLPMGTRCGQLDPGVVLYLMDQEKMNADEILNVLYRESGLKGLSGISNDMRELLASDDIAAAQAIDYFVFRIRRELGAMTAVLNGIDGLVFTGGIGENAWQIRERVCDDIDWLGVELDETRNRENKMVISSDRSRVRVFVIPTNEELMIAAQCIEVAGSGASAN